MSQVDVSVIVVSYNTRELTLACLRSVYAETRELSFELIVVDNASTDGSAEAIAREFPDLQLLSEGRNHGFAAANNLAAQQARGRYLLLLNPDTVVLDGAIQRLVQFADAHPEAGIYGGRTFYEDGSLNSTSCWARPTPWSYLWPCGGPDRPVSPQLALQLRGLRILAARTACGRSTSSRAGFLLIQRPLWEQLDGFDPIFFMYGEEADLCLRAIRSGAQPVIDPSASIVHHGGESVSNQAQKWVQMLHAKRRLAERHWPRALHGYARATLRTLVVVRVAATRVLAALGIPGASERSSLFREIWRRRLEWIG